MPPFIAEYACGKGSRKPYATGSAAIYRSGMHGDEKRVVDAFVAWLQNEGWTAEKEVNFADVFARRGDERLYAEAKGRTSEIGLDVDTLYGQLLRRMTDSMTTPDTQSWFLRPPSRRPFAYRTGYANG
jgi:hypothetical protein